MKNKILKEFEEQLPHRDAQVSWSILKDDVISLLIKAMEEQEKEHKKDLENLRIELNTLYKKSLDNVI